MTHRLFTRSVQCIAAAALALTGMQAFGETATITTGSGELGQDATLAQELPTNSSGGCDSIFSGNIDDQTVPSARRALIQFDIASQIPPGSTITSVELTMNVTRGGNHVDSTFFIHPVTSSWVEGTEDCGPRGGGQGVASAGGVNWNTMPGFGADSGSAPSVGADPVVWTSTAAMVADVQDWLDNPGNSNGWMVIGNETDPTIARRFDSREGGSAPSLLVTFDLDPNTPVEACCQADGSCSLGAVTSNCSGGQGEGTSCDPNLCPQPTGACCSADRICSVEDRGVCELAGGTFVGDNNCNQVDCGLTPFLEALPVPPILQPDNPEEVALGLKPKYTISVEEAVQSVHPNLPDTTVWTYNGSWPSSTIVATKDEPIEVTYINNLPVGSGNRGGSILEVDTCAHGPNDWGDSKRIVTHLHGAHLPARFDGQPEYTILPGETDIYQYPNDQDAATVWYHDHALGITRLNVYGGMAGFYLIRDDEDTLGLGDQTNAFNLPSAAEGNEYGLAIQDRTFDADGSLFYNAQLEDAFKGEYIVVNGKVNPYLEVNQGKYRFRVLNGSQSREYIYRLENITDPGDDPSFVLIGTDLGLIGAPLDLGNSTASIQGPGIIGPAERLDVVIDFASYPPGTEIVLRNDDVTLPLLPSIMKFIVTDQPGDTDALPATLRAVTPLPEGSEDATRYFRFAKHSGAACKDGSGRLVNEWLIESLDGPGGNVTGEFWDDITEYPVLGNREIWEFENPTNSYHPMHVHLVKFQILSKSDANGGDIPLQPWEINTWKDIVHIPANTTARIIMDFSDYLGRFPSHCHLLDHEDHEMMRQFQVTNDPANCTVDGICGPGEDCISCPGDCGQVSGALCGNGLCEAGDGEDCVTCPEDCAGKAKGPFCCGNGGKNPIGCGVDANDDRCIDSRNNLFCRVSERVSACCGDAMCEGQEEVQGADYCQVDCEACSPTGTSEAVCNGVDDDCDSAIDEDYVGTTTSCGVGVCAANGSTTCSGGVEGDNCAPGDPTEPTEATCDDGLDNDCDGLSDANDPDCAVCVPDETPEQSCFDGSDNDCDTLTDCSDFEDCDGVSDPARPTTCGVGACQSTGNIACSGGGEVNTCTPGTPGVEGPDSDASCSDGIDNDCDGQTDAADADCAGAVVCADITVDNGGKGACNNEPACEWVGSPKSGFCQDAGGATTENICDDGIDNDNDGATDCDDGDCAGDPACQTGGDCGNGTCDPGEDCNSCANDCAGVTGGKPANRYCCGNGVQEGPEGDTVSCDGNF